jgi:hypothetical protein
MSEYQYYEFQAVDRPLTAEEMAELRALSTRATITPTRLQNVYHWGDFKGDPSTLMEKYFDAFIYLANWGMHEFMLRLPSRLLEAETAQSYAVDGFLDIQVRGERLILQFTSEDEEGGDWVDDEEAASWMLTLLPLRAEIAGGDLRALYLGWLAGAEAGLLDDEEREPPLPPGLGQLSAALEALTGFLRLNEDLVAVAAAGTPDRAGAPSPDDLARGIAALPVSEKDALLLRLAMGDEAQVRAEILRRCRPANAPHPGTRTGGRTVAELLRAAEERAEQRLRSTAQRKAAEQARREQDQAAARTRYLDSLVGREEELWSQAEALIEVKRPREYDQAVQLLKDLHDSSARRDGADAFAARLRPLQIRYAKRVSLLDRLDRAGLRT